MARPPPRVGSPAGVGHASGFDKTGALARLEPARHGTTFWVALWAVAVAVEGAALVPIITGGPAALPAFDVVSRLIGGRSRRAA